MAALADQGLAQLPETARVAVARAVEAGGVLEARVRLLPTPGLSLVVVDVEGAVLDHVQKLLATPELVARTWATAKRADDDDVAEREVTTLLADFGTVWNELFPIEQARIVQLLVERVDVMEDALEVRIRAEGLASLVAELRQHDEEIARAA